MSLSLYKKKRSFNNTPEPEGGRSTLKDKLVFVVQKHDASRLHYDFRLEMEGVLKSWAVPKGPSLDPSVKRLAMMVEDHPYDYRDFEGIIPEGNYGAGTVIVWDEGTYTPIEKFPDKKSQEKHLLQSLKDGSLKFVLNGKKLKGEFALVRTNGMGENSWLLIKHKDKYASKTDITEKDKSVISGKTLEKVATSSNAIWQSNRKKNGREETTAKKTVSRPTEEAGKESNAQQESPSKAPRKSAPEKQIKRSARKTAGATPGKKETIKKTAGKTASERTA